jgi:hypothetical protein
MPDTSSFEVLTLKVCAVFSSKEGRPRERRGSSWTERGLQGRVVMEFNVKDGVQGGELKLLVAMALVCGQKDTKEIE